MPVAGPWELAYRDLLVSEGSGFAIRELDGLTTLPSLRTSDRTRLRRHGQLPGDDFLDGRAVVASIEVSGDDDTEFATNLAALQAALAPGDVEQPLTFKIPGVAGSGIRRINARPRRIALPINEPFYYRLPTATVEFWATDPRIYDDSETSVSTGLAASVPGLTWNLAWNLNWGGASTGNIVIATNSGTLATPMTVRFDGPVTNPGIENVDTGQILKLSSDGGLVVGSGEFVILDSANRTVLLGGTASRYNTLSGDSQWFDLPPGNTNLRFTGTTAGSPTMTVTFRSAWV